MKSEVALTFRMGSALSHGQVSWSRAAQADTASQGSGSEQRPVTSSAAQRSSLNAVHHVHAAVMGPTLLTRVGSDAFLPVGHVQAS